MKLNPIIEVKSKQGPSDHSKPQQCIDCCWKSTARRICVYSQVHRVLAYASSVLVRELVTEQKPPLKIDLAPISHATKLRMVTFNIVGIIKLQCRPYWPQPFLNDIPYFLEQVLHLN